MELSPSGFAWMKTDLFTEVNTHDYHLAICCSGDRENWGSICHCIHRTNLLHQNWVCELVFFHLHLFNEFSERITRKKFYTESISENKSQVGLPETKSLVKICCSCFSGNLPLCSWHSNRQGNNILVFCSRWWMFRTELLTPTWKMLSWVAWRGQLKSKPGKRFRKWL